MNKYLKPSEVLDTLQKKVDLKSSLKEAKKSKDIDSIDKISKKIAKLELKLQSKQLIKT
jgi:alkyl hydroperoxide reductase subunit AhpF